MSSVHQTFTEPNYVNMHSKIFASQQIVIDSKKRNASDDSKAETRKQSERGKGIKERDLQSAPAAEHSCVAEVHFTRKEKKPEATVMYAITPRPYRQREIISDDPQWYLILRRFALIVAVAEVH